MSRQTICLLQNSVLSEFRTFLVLSPGVPTALDLSSVIAHQVVELRVLDAETSLRIISEMPHPEGLKAFSVSHRVPVVITEITIAVKGPNFDWEKTSQNSNLKPTYFYSH
jgi:hypothetical protein